MLQTCVTLSTAEYCFLMLVAKQFWFPLTSIAWTNNTMEVSGIKTALL